MAKVTLDRLSKVYPNGFIAVADASFTVADGELLVLVGPSGCGKSTLLRMIAGLESISRGELRIDERVVNAVPPKDRDIAMVFQSYALYPHMTVADNLGFALKLRGASKVEISRRVTEAAKVLELDALLERKPAVLSGGQRQRVALGRALVRDPKVFLLDEPLSNLDAQLRTGMRVEIARLHRKLGATMIYVTHDQIEAMTMADRIVLLRDGRIEQQGAPLELYERPATRYVAGFLGSPAMNFVPATLTAAGNALAVRTRDGTALALPPSRAQALAAHVGRPVVLGVRPEHMSRSGAGDDRPGIVRHTVTIDLLQPTGARTYATFRLGETPVVAELQAHDVSQPGERIELAFDMNRVVLIDPGSELVIPG